MDNETDQAIGEIWRIMAKKSKLQEDRIKVLESALSDQAAELASIHDWIVKQEQKRPRPTFEDCRP